MRKPSPTMIDALRSTRDSARGIVSARFEERTKECLVERKLADWTDAIPGSGTTWCTITQAGVEYLEMLDAQLIAEAEAAEDAAAVQQATAAEGAPVKPVTVHVDWTHREGQRLTGIVVFSLTKAQDDALTAQGREPQFQLTGGTRRKSVDLHNDYGAGHGFTAERITLDEGLRQAAAWLGITAPLDVRVDHEYAA